MQEIKFSIILPIYNRENCIRNAIDSVVIQNYKNWELILVDDGSTDSTSFICKEYVSKYSNIEYFYKTNGGVCTARNYGLYKAVGDYVLFLDSDNSFKNNILCELSESLIQDIDVCCFGFGTNTNEWIPQITNSNIVSKENIRFKYLKSHINICEQNEHNFLQNYVWNKCFSRSFLVANNLFFDENRKTWEDGKFIVNVLDKAKTLLLLPKNLYVSDCEEQVNHLSSQLFKNQIQQYVDDEKEYKCRFENEFDFSSQHYCMSNFKLLCMLFEKSIEKYKKESIDFINIALEEEVVQGWNKNLIVQSKFDHIVKNLILNKEVIKIYYLYRFKILINRLKIFIKNGK